MLVPNRFSLIDLCTRHGYMDRVMEIGFREGAEVSPRAAYASMGSLANRVGNEC